MTKIELGQYCKLKKEVELVQNRLSKLSNRSVPEIVGKVQASEAEFPYLPYGVSVEMYEPKSNDAICKTINILKKRLERCCAEMAKVEQFIDGIADSELRQIFQMRYIDGMKLREIAEQIHQDLSGIGKKITEYIQLSNNSKNHVL